MKKDISRLVDPQRRTTSLPARTAPARIAAATARVQSSDPRSGGGGGIASPLTETGARTYHATRSVASSDGIIVLSIRPVANLTFTDANGAQAVLALANV